MKAYYIEHREECLARDKRRTSHPYNPNAPANHPTVRHRRYIAYRDAGKTKKVASNLAYQQLLELQDNNCAICRKGESIIDNSTKKPRALAVDHCHTTGKTRGLLCSFCNTGLGLFRDDPEILEQAKNYLEQHRGAAS